jgi:acetyl-CoA C-acetyltransferase
MTPESRVRTVKIDLRTPVLVGQAQVSQHEDNPAHSRGPLQLMEEALRQAAADAGLAATPDADLLHVVRSLSLNETNPGASLARNLNITARHTTYTPHGGNTPQWLVNDAAKAIQRGEADTILLVGGEAMRSRRLAKKAGITPTWFAPQSPNDPQPTPTTDDFVMNHEAEIALDITLPIEIYPMFETALRARDGRSIDDHQQRIAELWSRFAHVAASNPHAWSRTAHTADEIRTPTPRNRMIGFPYTKLMNSNNDVDMAAALIVCSAEKATSLGIPRDRWVFIHAGTDCHEHAFVSHRHTFTSTPAIRLGGRMALELAQTSLDDIDVIDLYSCFPSAVQLGAESLGLSLERPLTCTGGLSFAGGPFNNYVMHAIATTMTQLRDGKNNGFIWANGGYATKHSFGIYSTTPPTDSFMWGSPQPEIDSLPKRELLTNTETDATIEAYSVMHDRDGAPTVVRAALLTKTDQRIWAVSNDLQTAQHMCHGEWVGTPAHITADGTLKP